MLRYEQWLEQTASLLKSLYGLEPNDVDLDSRVVKTAYYDANYTPLQTVRSLGEKYDLVELPTF